MDGMAWIDVDLAFKAYYNLRLRLSHLYIGIGCARKAVYTKIVAEYGLTEIPSYFG